MDYCCYEQSILWSLFWIQFIYTNHYHGYYLDPIYLSWRLVWESSCSSRPWWEEGPWHLGYMEQFVLNPSCYWTVISQVGHTILHHRTWSYRKLMSAESKASVIREQRTGLVESKSFLDSLLIFLVPCTISSKGVGRGDGSGRSARTAWWSLNRIIHILRTHTHMIAGPYHQQEVLSQPNWWRGLFEHCTASSLQ